MTPRTLWPDTNITRRAGRFLALKRLATQRQVPVIIHPQVYLETRRFKRLEQGPTFDLPMFDSIFVPDGSVRVEGLMLDAERMGAWADILAERFVSKAAWQQAKGGGRASMSADWLISLTVESATNAFAITEDTGTEWAELRAQRRVMSFDEAESWLESLAPIIG